MITGAMLRDAVISASNNIGNSRQAVDALNIFPVPDGDTGTNMSMTIGAAAREIAQIKEGDAISNAADIAASALLRGARGNSGVILSLIFRGFSKGLKGLHEADGIQIAAALSKGVASAYKAVMKPTEGTILTVVRRAAEEAEAFATENNDPVDTWKRICLAAAEALSKTPEQLPVLKKAGVVDAGGQGLCLIFEGMRSVFEEGKIMESTSLDTVTPVSVPKNVVAQASSDIEFGYCSEFLIERDPSKPMDSLRLRAYLESIGDCVVVVDDDSIIKVHVHSNEPGNVIQAALKYGALINIKIDNMRYQHSNADTGLEGSSAALPVADPEKEVGFVAVAAGDGVQSLFADLGVDQLVKGGQTMNPSTDDILNAVLATPAKEIFVLPNNKNIIMAAEQVVPLASDRKVRVLHTRSIPQGISSMLAYDDSMDAEENHIAMSKAAERVGTGTVTFAARDSSVDGKPIKEGDIMGLAEGKIVTIDRDIVRAAYSTVKHLFKRGSSSFITILYGEGCTEEQADELKGMLENKYGDDVDITVVSGGQPVYYFILSVE